VRNPYGYENAWMNRDSFVGVDVENDKSRIGASSFSERRRHEKYELTRDSSLRSE
jgi:hypothetical protein